MTLLPVAMFVGWGYLLDASNLYYCKETELIADEFVKSGHNEFDGDFGDALNRCAHEYPWDLLHAKGSDHARR